MNTSKLLVSLLLGVALLLEVNAQSVSSFNNTDNANTTDASNSEKQEPLKDRMAILDVPAVSIAFMEDHKVVWTLTQGVIDLDSQKQIDSSTVFQTARISKPMYATVFLKYRQELGFDIDSDTSALLTRWQLPKQNISTLNAVSLQPKPLNASATSKLGYNNFKQDLTSANNSAVNDTLYRQRLSNPVAVLSNMNPNTAQRLTRERTSFAQSLVQYQNTKPARIQANVATINSSNFEQTSYSNEPSEKVSDNAALPHRTAGFAFEELAISDAALATRGIWTTPSKLLTRASNIQKRYLDLDHSLILSKTASQILSLQKELMSIGLILQKQDGTVTSFSDSSASNGFSTALFIHGQTGDGVAIMTNSENGRALVDDLLAQIIDVYEWDEPTTMDSNLLAQKSSLSELILKGNKHVEAPEIQSPTKPTAISVEVLMAEGEQY